MLAYCSNCGKSTSKCSCHATKDKMVKEAPVDKAKDLENIPPENQLPPASNEEQESEGTGEPNEGVQEPREVTPTDTSQNETEQSEGADLDSLEPPKDEPKDESSKPSTSRKRKRK